MPSARGNFRWFAMGAIVAVCGTTVVWGGGAPAPDGKAPAAASAPPRDGVVQQALRNLYIVPKAPDGKRADTAPAAWRDENGSVSARRDGTVSTETSGAGRTGRSSRWSPNLATRQRLRAPAVGQKTSGGGDLGSAGPGGSQAVAREADRAYSPRSIGGYRGYGEYGYGRQGYADYRRTLRWPGYSVEGYDEIRGAYHENFSYYGDGAGYGGGMYGDGGYDYGYFENQANARTQSLLHSALTSRDRGLAAFREGRYREAADAFRLACETNQGDPAAQLYAGHALFAIGRYRDGVKHLRRALELQPKIVFLTYDMRDDYRDRAEFDRQFAALEDALRLAPRDEDRLFMMGYVLYYGGQRDRAYDALARLARLNPRDGVARRLLEACQPPDVMLGPAPSANRP